MDIMPSSRCLVLRCAGVIYSQLRRDELWGRYYTDATDVGVKLGHVAQCDAGQGAIFQFTPAGCLVRRAPRGLH